METFIAEICDAPCDAVPLTVDGMLSKEKVLKVAETLAKFVSPKFVSVEL